MDEPEPFMRRRETVAFLNNSRGSQSLACRWLRKQKQYSIIPWPSKDEQIAKPSHCPTTINHYERQLNRRKPHDNSGDVLVQNPSPFRDGARDTEAREGAKPFAAVGRTIVSIYRKRLGLRRRIP